ncbi:MAG: ADP-ribosylglycohydrolase family protein [Gloeotrichia echinulata GP01]
MRYSVYDRFRGTILGALVGESLASSRDIQSHTRTDLDSIAVLGAQSLIELGLLDLDDWRNRQQQESLQLDANDTTFSKRILSTLPVALFFHENTIKLRQNLLSVLQIWEDDPVLRDGTLAVGYAIAQSLTEKLHPRTLIPDMIAFIGQTPTSIPQQLSKVNSLLEQGAGLDKVQTELSREDKYSNIMAMAFYCFLSTLEDYRLAVLRATHNGDVWRKDPWRLHSQSISAITGALSGSYNSTAGIPVAWRGFHSPADSAESGLTNFSLMVELAKPLVAVWSGVYNLALDSSELKAGGSVMFEEQPPLCVFASPRVIRFR